MGTMAAQGATALIGCPPRSWPRVTGAARSASRVPQSRSPDDARAIQGSREGTGCRSASDPRGLTRAVWAQEPVNSAGFALQIEAHDGRAPSEGPAQLVRLNGPHVDTD